MSVFFTADTHFGDPHIVRQRGGTFGSLAEHDEDLIARWNATVAPTDEVWHLGDFAAGASRERCAEIFARLAGRKAPRSRQSRHQSRARPALGRHPGRECPRDGAGRSRGGVAALPRALRPSGLAGPLAWDPAPLRPHPRQRWPTPPGPAMPGSTPGTIGRSGSRLSSHDRMLRRLFRRRSRETQSAEPTA